MLRMDWKVCNAMLDYVVYVCGLLLEVNACFDVTSSLKTAIVGLLYGTT